MEWLPAASEDDVNAARQLLSSETLPSTFVPSVKVTVPVAGRASPKHIREEDHRLSVFA